MEPLPRLTCERCKQRKIRCDKRNPCSACEIARVSCEFVQRARLPRGRSANVRKVALEKRLERLESLLRQMPQRENSSQSYSGSIEPTLSRSGAQLGGFIGELVAPEFWASLTEEIAGLRETLELSEDNEGCAKSPVPKNGDAPSMCHPILFGSAKLTMPHGTSATTPFLPEDLRSVLFSLYLQRVDCVYKILHWPTFLTSIEGSRSTAQNETQLTPIKALELSTYFMALCSITNEEGRNLGFGDRDGLLDQYRNATEIAISRAGLLQKPSLPVLQAFVIYLIGCRVCYNSAVSWTLLSLAIRVGTALRLGQEDPHRFDPFELEIRRRLWYCIALVDTSASFDRGTLPMLRWDELGPAPILLSDQDTPTSVGPGVLPSKFNDMSCCRLMFHAMECHKKLISIPDSTEEGWAAKLQLVSNFEHFIQRDYLNIEEAALPLERFAAQAAKSIAASMHLLLRRPPYKRDRQLIPPSDNFDFLGQATKILEHELEIRSSEFAPWAWKSVVQWHALAIVLAELCGHPHGEEFDYAYNIAVQAFNHYSCLIADSDTGMLWKPIAKLMGRVEQMRPKRTVTEATDANASVKSGSSPTSAHALVLDFTQPPNALSSDPCMPNIDSSFVSEVEDAFIIGGDQGVVDNYDSQLNWSMFVDELNLDYPLDWKDSLS